MPRTTEWWDKVQEICERLLSGGRLQKTLIADGAVFMGPGTLYG